MTGPRGVLAIVCALCALLLAARGAADTPVPRRPAAPVTPRVPVRPDRPGRALPDSLEREQLPASYAEHYLDPLAYPGTSLDIVARDSVFKRLIAVREQVRQPYQSMSLLANEGNFAVGPACGWISAGPGNINGRVCSIATSRLAPARIFLATPGGIWRSEDSGRRWENVTEPMQDLPYGCVAVNPAKADEVFAGTGDANRALQHDTAVASSYAGVGLLWSEAGGRADTWRSLGPPLIGQTIFKILVDPSRNNDVYLATSAGVWKSNRSSGGWSWSLLGGLADPCCDLVADFSASLPVIYAATYSLATRGAGEIRKYDAGPAWRTVSSGIPAGERGVILLALCESQPASLYARIEKDCASCPGAGALLDLFRTSSAAEGAGNAWSRVNVTGTLGSNSWYYGALAVDPGDPENVYLGGLRLYHRRAGTAPWTDLTNSADPNYAPAVGEDVMKARLHDDIHAVLFDPGDSKRIYAASDGGLDRVEDITATNWHWDHISHGVNATEVYSVSVQPGQASVIAAGAQDVGRIETLGNHTWYGDRQGDYYIVGIDAENPCLIYGTVHRKRSELAPLTLLTNPVVGTEGFDSRRNYTDTDPFPTFPVVTAPDKSMYAYAAAVMANDKQTLVTTDNASGWTELPGFPQVAADRQVWSLAVSTGTIPRYVYAGVRAVDPDHPAASVIASETEGGNAASWHEQSAGLPDGLLPATIAVDPVSPERAFVGFGGARGTRGGVSITLDAGVTWSELAASGPADIKDKPVLGLVVDPVDRTYLYVATYLGVFRGKLSSLTSTDVWWEMFDLGLPNAVRCTALAISTGTRTLTLATMGHGVYQCDLDDAAGCASKGLLVRDNVYDTGDGPAPPDFADPESPIAWGTGGLFQPDGRDGHRITWWDSPDIRTYVEDAARPQNAVTSADAVEFESCPVGVADCPPGTMIDGDVACDGSADLYVQVNNRSAVARENVRVLAIWTSPSPQLPPLPADFWTTTFPAGATTCGPLNLSTGWKLVDQCQEIPRVTASAPGVAKFHWSIPDRAGQHSCVMVFVDSPDDPIPAKFRQTPELNVSTLTKSDRHITLRNLHVVGCPIQFDPRHVEIVWIYRPAEEPDTLIKVDVLLDERLTLNPPGILLPPDVSANIPGLRWNALKLGAAQRRVAERNGLNPTRLYVYPAKGIPLRGLRVRPGRPIRMGLVYDTRTVRRGQPPARMTVRLVSGRKVLGGNTFIFQAPRSRL